MNLTLDEFPEKILKKIFQHVPNKNNCALTCQKFKKVAESTGEFTLFLNEKKISNISSDPVEFHLLQSTKRIFSKVVIEDVTLRYDSVRIDLINILKKIVLFVKELIFSYCKSSSEDIIQLLAYFQSLQKLVIEESKISGTTPKNWRLNRLCLKNLKSFQVMKTTGEKAMDSDYLWILKAFARNTLNEIKFNGVGKDQILIEILHNQKSVNSLDIDINGSDVPDLSFLRLKNLVLNIRDYNVSYESVLRAIRSQHDLTDLHVADILVYPILFLDILILENLQILDINLNDIPAEFVEFFEALQLKAMTVRSIRPDYNYQLLQLSNVSNERLETLELDFPEISNDSVSKFSKNNPNVTSVIMSVDKNADKTFDAVFRSFHNVEVIDILRTERTADPHKTVDLYNYSCKSLTKVRLNTLFTTNIKFYFDQKSMRNFLKTMPRLEHLSIKGNCFTEEDIETIVIELPLLKTLELDECTGNADTVFAMLCEYGECLEGVELYGLEFMPKAKVLKSSRFRAASLRSHKPVMHLLCT